MPEVYQEKGILLEKWNNLKVAGYKMLFIINLLKLPDFLKLICII
jgi:hypothetical protein